MRRASGSARAAPDRLPRLPLAHLPTPLRKPQRLADALGIDLWVKRDDMTGGPEGGNKIRKLELLLADAIAAGAGTVITCGGLQSNHARATAVCAATLGLGCALIRWRTGSLWPAVALHWLVVVTWQTLLGGPGLDALR